MSLQRLCAMFLVHFGVNLWTLNDELMSAYDVAVASRHASLARFLDAVASQTLVDDWHGVMKLCRRAADNARRRLRARRQSSATQPPHSVDLDVQHRLHNTSHSPNVNGWHAKTLPDGPSSSSTTSFSPSSSMFVQSPRQANGSLFPAATASDTQSGTESTDWRKQQRFWPRSAREHGGECEQRLRVAAAARQLLLMSVDDDSQLHDAQLRVIREQLRMSSPAGSRCTTTDANRLTPSSRIDFQFYCRPRITDNMSAERSSEVISDSTQASAEGPPTMCPPGSSCATSKQKKAASRRHRQAADVSSCSRSAGDVTSNCSDVYSDPADCIQRHHPAGLISRSTSLQSSHLSSESGHPQTSVSVHNDDDPLRHWLVNNGLAEYWSPLATEKVDLETLALLRDDDLRQLGVPLGPRRRLQRAASQLQSTAHISMSDITHL